MCDGSTSPRSSSRVESSPELLLREPAPEVLDRDSRRKPACLDLTQSPSHVSHATTGSTHDTATSPSPRRKVSGFVWADASPGDWDEADLPESWCRLSMSEEASADQTAHGCGSYSRGSSPGRASDEQAMLTDRWQPNPCAAEFIPMSTSRIQCVLVGVPVCCPQGHTPGLVDLGTAPSNEEVAELAAKAEASAADSAADVASALGAAPTSSRRHKPGTGKCRPAPLVTVPADPTGRMPVDDAPASLENQVAEAVAEVPEEEATDKPGDCIKGLHVMPEATEEEWQHRAQLRTQAIESGKGTKEYRLYCDTKKDYSQGCEEPRTPDPYDRTISKRNWKYLLRQWRTTFAQRCLEEDNLESVVSTEDQECLSIGRSPAEDPEGPSTIGGDSDSEFFASEMI